MMRISLAAALALWPGIAFAELEHAAAFFSGGSNGSHKEKAKVFPRGRAQEVVARTAREKLGEGWVHIALAQAKRESGFNPLARNRSSGASGVFQVLPSTARGMGYDPQKLFDLEYGAKVGVAYMGHCIKAGVSTDAQMNSCFLRGFYNWRANHGPERGNRKVRSAHVRHVSNAANR
jgi:hypothetical protein